MAGRDASDTAYRQWGEPQESNRELLDLQQRTMEEQDKGLDSLLVTVQNTKRLGTALGDEIDSQIGMLDDLEAHTTKTSNRVQKETKNVIVLTRKAKAAYVRVVSSRRESVWVCGWGGRVCGWGGRVGGRRRRGGEEERRRRGRVLLFFLVGVWCGRIGVRK